jgi:hypothetical protein
MNWNRRKQGVFEIPKHMKERNKVAGAPLC